MHDMENSTQQSVAGSQQPFMDDGSATLYQGDCLDVLRRLPSESVHCCVTSPPYFGLRDYGTAEWKPVVSSQQSVVSFEDCDHKGEPMRTRAYVNQNTSDFNDVKNAANHQPMKDVCSKCGAVRIDAQIGLEATPAEFVAKMVEVFTEVRRVLRKDGTLWLNLGDSYASNWPCSRRSTIGSGSLANGKREARPPRLGGLKDKDLMGMPWRVAFALQEAGWWLRQDIIWSKPNPMPESVTDRCTKAHEYIFLLSKSAKYFYDAQAIKQPVAESTVERGPVDFGGAKGRQYQSEIAETDPNYRNGSEQWGRTFDYAKSSADGCNKRSVWTVTTQPYSEAHFATFPPKLIEPCVLAGTSEKGCCGACGSPYERVSVVIGKQVTEAMKIAGCDANGEYHGQATKDYESAQAQNASDTKRRILEKMSQITESGWQKTCKCETEDISPAVVLDPFGGAGTTLLVAKRLGRKSVGIELNPEYCKLIERRLEHWHKPSPPKAVDDSFVGTLFEGIDQEVAA